MDIKLLGLEELSTKEMKTCNGGVAPLVVGVIIVAMLLLGTQNAY